MANACLTYDFKMDLKKYFNYSNYAFRVHSSSQKATVENIDCKTLNAFFPIASRIVKQSNYDVLNSEIDNIFTECSTNGWDYNDALPVSIRAVSNAKKFVEFIENLQSPEINPYPTSDLGFSWRIGNAALNIIFNDNDQIIYVISKNNEVTSGYFDLSNIEIVYAIVEDFLK